MAEDEIRKHTKAAISAATGKQHGWKHKLHEILLEVMIIIFAVSVSIWLHNWSDGLKEKKEAKEFLQGLKLDLEVDTFNLVNSKSFYQQELDGINYFLAVAAGQPLSNDSLAKYNFVFSASTNLEANTSRYTGFKGSAKFEIIENKDLLGEIIDLHEVVFSHIQVLDNVFNNYNATKTEPYVFAHVQLDNNFNIRNAEEVVRSSQMKLQMLLLKSLISNSIIPYHQKAIGKCKEVMKGIDDELD